MLTIIVFLVGCVTTYSTSLIFLSNSMSYDIIIAIATSSILGMILINGLVATIICKWLPKKVFNFESKIFVVSKREYALYEKLGIKTWKDKTLDLGQLNGFKKDKIENSVEHVQRFILENNLGFIEHFISAIVSVLSIFILPKKFWLPVMLPISITSFIINVMSIMILRYNMPRLKTMLKFTLRNSKK